MAKRMNIQKLCEISENVRAIAPMHKHVLKAEIDRNGTTAILESIQFARNEKTGKPTRKLIECFDNGQHCYYDRSVYLIVTAISVESLRVEM